MKRSRRALEQTDCAAGVVRRASRSLTRLYDSHLAGAGVTTTQFSILRTLQRNGGRMALAGLAADLVFERTSLYRALTPLRRGGLVTIQTGVVPRAHDVSLTRKGERCIEKAMPRWVVAQRLVLDRLGPAAWSTLARRLVKLTAVARSGHAR